jgi:radical SAM protein with 4Fe4S-binding SPASM domain
MKNSEALLKLPGMFIQSSFSFTYDGIPLVAHHLSPKQKMNLLKLGLSSLMGSNRVAGLPAVIQVEPTDICNLKCPLCPASDELTNRKHGYMSLETFQKILEELGDVLIAVYLYSWGEPFLNRDIFRIIESWTSHNILTLIPTNGQCLQTVDEALAVVDSGLTVIIIAIDGSTQEIYQSYRKGGDLEKVKRCAALIEKAKAKRKSQLPYTCMRTVVTRDNQHDLPSIEQIARDLGMNMFSTKTVGCKIHDEAFKDYEPTAERLRRFEYDGEKRIEKAQIQCIYPFRQPTVKWDGTVVGCEFDYKLEFPWGKIGEKRFSEIWNGPEAIDLRHSIRKGTNDRFCGRHCPFQDRVQGNCYISCNEIRPIGR